ncbi:ATPase [Plantactinospora sp. B5E13]|uniref:ATPase n=1 Tax=Plantactinospora sp. B5E13 TaxID=3153758 RepID=UPI00325F35C3
MESSVVEVGYDQERNQDQIDRCLQELGERLARLAAPTDAAANVGPELAQARAELVRLGDLLAAHRATAQEAVLRGAEREAAEIRARAQADLAAARAEARQVRDRVYAEAVQARRDFEAALQARRLRAERADEILRAVPDALTARPGTDTERAAPVAVTSTPDSRR